MARLDSLLQPPNVGITSIHHHDRKKSHLYLTDKATDKKAEKKNLLRAETEADYGPGRSPEKSFTSGLAENWGQGKSSRILDFLA